MEHKWRPSDDFILHRSWKLLYQLNECWRRSLTISRVELDFYIKMIEAGNWRHKKNLREEDIMPVFQAVEGLVQNNRDLEIKVDLHIRHLEQLIENSYPSDPEEFRKEQMRLESDIQELEINISLLKRDVFELLGDKDMYIPEAFGLAS